MLFQLKLNVSKLGSVIVMFTSAQLRFIVVPFGSVGEVKFRTGGVASAPPGAVMKLTVGKFPASTVGIH